MSSVHHRGAAYISILAVSAAMLSVACATSESNSLKERDLTAAETWVADASPVFDVAATGDDGERNFAGAVGAVELSTGAVLVVSGWSASVSLFDRTGRLVSSTRDTARMASAAWAGECRPDSIFVWDRVKNRVEVLGPTGRIAREFAFPVKPVIVSCSPDGQFALLGTPQDLGKRIKRGDGTALEARVWLVNDLGSIVGNIRPVVAGYAVPFGRVTRIARTNTSIFVGTGDSAYVDRYSAAGTFTGAIRTGVAAHAPTISNKKRAIDRMTAFLTVESQRATAARMLANNPMPPRLPPYSEILTDSAGVVWVVLSSPGDATTRLRAFNRGGAVIRDATIPCDVDVIGISGSRLIAVRRDSVTGVQHVSIYALHKTGSLAERRQ